MKFRIHALLVFVVVGLAAYQSETAYSDDDGETSKDRLLEGAGVNRDQAGVSSFRVRCKVHQQYATPSAEYGEALQQVYGKDLSPDPEVFEVVRSTGMLKESGHDGSTEYVMARNEKYAFRITRGSNSEAYALTWLEPCGVDPDKDAFIDKEALQSLAFPLAGSFALGMPLVDLLDSPECRIRSVGPDPEQPQLVRVEFDYDSENPNTRTVDGYLLCEPESSWAVVEYWILKEGGGTTRQVVELSERDGFPLAKRIVQTITAQEPEMTLEATIDVEPMDIGHVDEQEFYLSHYGLPEPNFERPWYGSWLGYLIGGIGCLAVAYWWGVRQRRGWVT